MPPKRYFDQAYDLQSREDTLNHYSKWAKTYDAEVDRELAYAQPARVAATLKKLLNEPSAHILDVGCGTGLSGGALREIGYSRIDGCDFSPEMLAKAEEKSVYRELFETDLNNPPMPVEDDFYDAAIAVGVFSFGHVHPDAMDEILRVIKPNANLIIGLNDHYYDEGSLPKKLDQLVSSGAITVLSQEHGDHLPVKNIKGWVIALRKQA